MSIIDDMSYRGITQEIAQGIGMAASVAGGYVAIDGPRLRRMTRQSLADDLAYADVDRRAGRHTDATEREDYAQKQFGHRIQGGDGVLIIDPAATEVFDGEERKRHPPYTYADAGYVLCVPADGPLADEGYSLPAALIAELLPLLRAAGYGDQPA